MELLDLELRRAEHWQQREGVAVADVGSKLLAYEPLSPAEARLAAAMARQEPALYLGLSLLLSMAEQDVRVEQKMVNKVWGGRCSCACLWGWAALHFVLQHCKQHAAAWTLMAHC